MVLAQRALDHLPLGAVEVEVVAGGREGDARGRLAAALRGSGKSSSR